MPEIAFLLGDTELARNDNHRRLPAAFATAGWGVACLSQEAVRLSPAGVTLGDDDPGRFDLIWLVGMGRAETFFDRMQLLRLLPQERFVTPVDALIHLHAKYAWWPHMPETHASGDPDYLKGVLRRGGRWVAKPAAGSYGRDVVRIERGAAGEAVIHRLTRNGAFCLLQRFVPKIARGEKRTLVAAGQPVGTYLRTPEADFRANLAAGGKASPTTLSRDEAGLVSRVSQELANRGVGFAAVDTVYPYLMEVNLANPGGLATLADVYGIDAGAAVVRAFAGAPRDQ